MAELVWTGKMSVGVEAMDDQHRQLLELFQSLHDLVSGDPDPGEIGSLLKEILRVARIHVHDEEQLMERYQYPGAREHQKQHRDLIKQLQQKYLVPIVHEELDITPEIVQQAVKPVLKHMTSDDKKYGAYVNARRPIAVD